MTKPSSPVTGYYFLLKPLAISNFQNMLICRGSAGVCRKEGLDFGRQMINRVARDTEANAVFALDVKHAAMVMKLKFSRSFA